MQLDGRQVVIVSRTCDVQPGRDNPAHVADLVEVDDDRARLGHHPRLVRVPGKGADWFADMRTVMPVDLALLPEGPDLRGCTTEDESNGFRREAGRWLSMVSAHDDVVAATRPLWKDMRKHVRDDSPYKRLADAIRDIRHRLLPISDEAVTMELFFLIDGAVLDRLPEPDERAVDLNSVQESLQAAQTIDELGAVLGSYCRVMAAKAKPTGIVEDVSFDVRTTHEMSVHDYLATAPLELDWLSIDHE